MCYADQPATTHVCILAKEMYCPFSFHIRQLIMYMQHPFEDEPLTFSTDHWAHHFSLEEDLSGAEIIRYTAQVAFYLVLC